MKKDIGYSQEGGQELPTMTPLLARLRACVHTHAHYKKKIYSFNLFHASLLLFFICTNVNTHRHELECTYTT